MSAETDYLQRHIDLKFAFDTEFRFQPPNTRLPWKMQVGVEITIVEANRMDAFYDKGGTFHASIAPGQKSYIRGTGSEYIQASGGLQIGSKGIPVPSTFRAGLRFPDPLSVVQRWYAYQDASTNWAWDVPFQNARDTRLGSVEISLVPFSLQPNFSGLPEGPDDRVHLMVRRADREIVLLSTLTLDETTQQLFCHGPSMDTNDNASLWIISFYIAPGPIV